MCGAMQCTCLAPWGFISMAHIPPLLLSAIQHCGVPRLLVRMFSALIFLLPAAEAWSGEGMVHHMMMTFTGQPGDGSPVTHIPKSIEGPVQMAANNQAPLAYFLDQLPPDMEASKLPSSARDVVIAKVRVLEHPSWLGKRHSADLPRDVFFIRLRILDVRRGSAAIGADYNIYFGERGKDIVFPNTPEQLAREYIVMMYLDADDIKHRLVGFPISNAQYSRWQAEVSEYRRSRLKQ